MVQGPFLVTSRGLLGTMDAGTAGVQSTNQFSMTILKWQSFPCQQQPSYATMFALNTRRPFQPLHEPFAGDHDIGAAITQDVRDQPLAGLRHHCDGRAVAVIFFGIA